ncbi:MAG: hypothetical protein A2Z09_02165 [Nitrospirae bacterium RBG_16_43_8]|nr:MAG: hypothetical protein A2Z09_02165 [Nitrospirae bacterium RBG_16_43_8]
MINKLPKERVRAVHDQDLENILDGLGILNKFKRGELTCKFCKNTISFGNLHSIFPQSGDIKFACDESDCVRNLYKLLEDGDISL